MQWRYQEAILFQLAACILGFKHPNSLYPEDKDFREVYSAYQKRPKGDFLIQEGFYLRVYAYVSQSVVSMSF